MTTAVYGTFGLVESPIVITLGVLAYLEVDPAITSDETLETMTTALRALIEFEISRHDSIVPYPQ